jgi:hemoglobin
MNLEITTIYDGKMPNVQLPNPGLYTSIGEEGIRKMISDHYDLLVKSKIAAMFPDNEEALNMAKQRSADFFIQIMGGRRYYEERRGNPMLRKRHMPFPIDMEARIEWLSCYREVLLQIDAPELYIQSYWNYLDKFSLWMMNR